MAIRQNRNNPTDGRTNNSAQIVSTVPTLPARARCQTHGGKIGRICM